MNVQVLNSKSSNPLSVSDVEWSARLELAAAYRIMAHYGACDLAHNHLCLRVPDEPDALLIKHTDAFFEEVNASNLCKYDFQGSPRQEGIPNLRGGGLIIHAGILAARPDINATIHSHTAAIMGVASQRKGLLPINQHAMYFLGKIVYHDFGGFEFDMRQRAPLIRDLGDKKIALLRNHGSLVCGTTIGGAMVAHNQLEIACQGQIAALSAGEGEIVLVSPEAQEYSREQVKNLSSGRDDGGKDWKGMLRMADRMFPDYRD